jgi:polyferredoxin
LKEKRDDNLKKGKEASKSELEATEQTPKKSFPKIEAARKITQFCFFLLFNATVFGLGPWPILLPVLNSLAIPQKTVGDALGALQLMLYEVLFPLLPLASFFLTAIIFGRATCGWVCPFGFVQDLLSHVKGKHREISLRTHRGMINFKHGILLIILFISGTLAASSFMRIGGGYRSALGVFAPAPFNMLSPADTLFAVLPKTLFDVRYALSVSTEKIALEASPLFWVRLVIMIAFLVLAVYIPRSWCRYFCPEGAFLSLISRFSFLGLRREPVKCTKAGCRECVEACPMMVRILDLPWEKFTDPECIYCLKCVEACPTKSIRPKLP